MKNIINYKNAAKLFTFEKKSAFTLAEVLITLTIIGVIAALTIPNLLQNYNEQATVSKVKKFYSTISNAYALAMKENGPIDEWGLPGNNSASAQIIYEKLLKPNFKIAKNCGVNNDGNCVSNNVAKGLNKNDVAVNYGTNDVFYKVTLNDGSAIILYSSDGSDIIFINDINGPKAPNQWGVDTFYFRLHPFYNKVVPFGIQSGTYSIYPFDENCQISASGNLAGIGCAAWVIYKGNMDYLHCDGLTWNSRSCKDK